MIIRPGRKDDARSAAILIRRALEPLTSSWTGTNAEEEALKGLEDTFRQEENRMSHQNASVAEWDEQVVGLISSFGGREEERLNRGLEAHLAQVRQGFSGRIAREATDDEWYIDVLAVDPHWEGKGIGRALIQVAEEKAVAQHYPRIALSVAKENEPAIRLYQHLHYDVIEERSLYGHPYLSMVKNLSEKVKDNESK